MESIRNVIVIGGGPAGYTAALYAARAELKPLIIAGIQAGGQLMLTTDVENFPGFPKGVQGPDLMEKMRDQAERFGAELINENVTEVGFGSPLPFKVKTDEHTFLTNSVIIATGADAKWLGLDSEQRLIGSGVSSCATCDGAFFKEKVVVTIGGGDSAMEEALFLTRYAQKVYLVHRSEQFRASKIMLARARENKKIQFVTNTIITDVLSKQAEFFETVTGVVIQNTLDKTTEKLEIDGLFLAIGHIPNTKIFEDKLELDEEGYVIVKHNTNTNVEGIFAAGDVVDKRYRQAITAAAEGCKAAIDATRWLEEKGLS